MRHRFRSLYPESYTLYPPRGFTLVEMLVATFIALIIMVVGFTLLNGATLARAEAQARIQASDSARVCFEMLERDLAGANPGPWSPYSKQDLVHGDALVAGDIVEMIGSGEDTSTGLDVVGVRYFVYPSDAVPAPKPPKRLYRQTESRAAPTTLNPTAPEPFPAPFALPASLNDFALLPNTEDLTADYLRWYEPTKQFLTWSADQWVDPANGAPVPGDPNFSDATYAFATHLDAKLKFLDPNERLPIGQRTRIFRKLMAIPAAFRN